MRSYDPTKPLIFSHIPKTAGISVQRIAQGWFGENLLLHYRAGAMPERHDTEAPPLPGRPVVIYGHFNHQRNFGMSHYYPEIDQFVTILRDPWERVISGYFFRRRPKQNVMHPKFQSLSLEEYLENWPYEDPDMGPPVNNFLPQPCTLATWREIMERHCVAIGTTEDLVGSLTRMAERLGVDFDPGSLEHRNAAARTREIPEHLKPAFIRRNVLEYALYDYACDQSAR